MKLKRRAMQDLVFLPTLNRWRAKRVVRRFRRLRRAISVGEEHIAVMIRGQYWRNVRLRRVPAFWFAEFVETDVIDGFGLSNLLKDGSTVQAFLPEPDA